MIAEYSVTVVPGTGSININLAGVHQATGIHTSAGATVIAVSNVSGGNGATTANLGNAL